MIYKDDMVLMVLRNSENGMNEVGNLIKNLDPIHGMMLISYLQMNMVYLRFYTGVAKSVKLFMNSIPMWLLCGVGSRAHGDWWNQHVTLDMLCKGFKQETLFYNPIGNIQAFNVTKPITYGIRHILITDAHISNGQIQSARV